MDAGLLSTACIFFLSQTRMALRAATVHENFVFVLERLCQLSRLGRFCQFQDLIDFTDKTLMALKPPLVPGSGF